MRRLANLHRVILGCLLALTVSRNHHLICETGRNPVMEESYPTGGPTHAQRASPDTVSHGGWPARGRGTMAQTSSLAAAKLKSLMRWSRQWHLMPVVRRAVVVSASVHSLHDFHFFLNLSSIYRLSHRR